MKKIYILIGMISLLLLIASGGFLYYQTIHKNSTQDTKVQEITFLPNVTNDSFSQLISHGEEFSVLIWRPDCGDSQRFIKEFLGYFAEYNESGQIEQLKYHLDNPDKKFYSFDISEIIDSIGNTDVRLQYKDLYGFYYTPSLVHYKDLNGDGVSEVQNIAEWDPVYGFKATDYFSWFYDNQLITPQTEVYHDGTSDRQN